MRCAEKAINELATQFLEQIKAKKGPDQAVNDALYSALVLSVPEVQQKARIVIVPDGNLHVLPFDHFVTNKATTLVTS